MNDLMNEIHLITGPRFDYATADEKLNYLAIFVAAQNCCNDLIKSGASKSFRQFDSVKRKIVMCNENHSSQNLISLN